MNNTFDKLNEVFDISSEIISQEKIDITQEDSQKKDIKIETNANDIRRDYEYTRGNLYSIIEKGQEALNSALELAQETEQPRAYEVVGQLIKNVSDSMDKLMDLQKKIKEIEEDRTISGPTNVTNALFVGSTTELSKLLKSQRKQDKNK